jgi:hypothetical protein
LKNCIDGRKESLTRKQIQVLEDSPAIISLILAEPAQLTGIFTDVLDLLIEDSDSNGSSLTIEVRETQTEQDEGKIMLNFRNEGYGMPQENLDRFLQLLKESPTELAQDGEKLEQLLLSVHQANYWGVELDIQSTLGSGFDVQLSIPVFVIK